MKINIKHSSNNFDSFRANKVKSLFNAENGHTWEHVADIPIEEDFQIGLIVGPSGSGKTSIGKQVWEDTPIHDLYANRITSYNVCYTKLLRTVNNGIIFIPVCIQVMYWGILPNLFRNNFV